MNEAGKLKPGESLIKQFDYYNGTFDEGNQRDIPQPLRLVLTPDI